MGSEKARQGRQTVGSQLLRSLGSLGMLAWSLGCTGCLPHRDAEELPVIHDGLSEVAQSWIHAVESADLDAIANLHMPNSRAYPLDKGQLKGMQDITGDYADLFSNYTVRLVVRDAHYLTTPQLTYSWGLAEWTLTPRRRNAEPIVVVGRFSDLAALDHGRWRYVMEHGSSAVPLVAAASAPSPP